MRESQNREKRKDIKDLNRMKKGFMQKVENLWLENTQYEERLKIRWRTVQLLCISIEKECQWADVCDPSWVQGLGSIPAFVVAWNICKKDIENANNSRYTTTLICREWKPDCTPGKAMPDTFM